jgi:hypothetical protein
MRYFDKDALYYTNRIPFNNIKFILNSTLSKGGKTSSKSGPKSSLSKIEAFKYQSYSYFRASTGIIVAARKAGYKPESIPINVANIRAKMGSQAGV